jgi:hypothetical protein
MTPIVDEMLNSMFQNMDDPNGEGRVLFLGGTHHETMEFVKEFYDNDFSVYLTEPDKEVVEEYTKCYKRLKVKCTPVDKVAYREEHFHVVIVLDSLNEDNKNDMYKAIGLWLKPGGLLLVNSEKDETPILEDNGFEIIVRRQVTEDSHWSLSHH